MCVCVCVCVCVFKPTSDPLTKRWESFATSNALAYYEQA